MLWEGFLVFLKHLINSLLYIVLPYQFKVVRCEFIIRSKKIELRNLHLIFQGSSLRFPSLLVLLRWEVKGFFSDRINLCKKYLASQKPVILFEAFGIHTANFCFSETAFPSASKVCLQCL